MKTQQMIKTGLAVAVCGSMLHWGGCLGLGNWRQFLPAAATSLAVEFLTDNDGIFDLFQDDFGTGTTYDDRFTGGDATRVEPVTQADAGQNFAE